MTTGSANGRRFCFLTERQVGIGSAAAALEPWVCARPNVVWKDITYFEPGGVIERLKLGGRAAGTLRGYLQSGVALRQGRYDALFFLTHNPAVFRQSELGRTPTLLWTDVTPALLDAQAEQYEHPVDTFRPLKAIKQTMVRRTFERAALLVGWSDWARRSFVSDYGAPELKTRVVPPGIDLSRWTAGERSTGEGLPRLLFVGGNLVRKGGDLLLDVFRRHFRGRCALDIVTRDELAEEDGVRVHRGLTPTSPKLLDLYRSATAFVLPTRGDCFSIASIEAMAMGLPVVVSEVGGISEIVLPRETGHLIRPGDGGELREAIDSLLADTARRRTMGASGRARAEACFDARKTADRLIALMDEIASARV
jgi:glycosyltransferase involved in cell wall biosynthesis